MKKQNVLLVVITLFATVIALWLVPALVKKATYSPDKYPFTYYSSGLKKICIVDRSDKQYPMRDMEGNKYTDAECDSLMPLFNYRQLMANGALPDSIDGVEITPQLLRTKSVMYRYTPKEMDAPQERLHVLFEAMPKRLGLEMPGDFFRMDDNIEFIDAATNTVNAEKSRLFAAELNKRGYQFPTEWAAGNPTTRKAYEEGYFCKDANGHVFHVKMVNGRPFVRDTHVSDAVDVAHFAMMEPADKRFYGFMIDKDGYIYILEGDEGKYFPTKLDVPAMNPAEDELLVMGDLLYWTVSITTPTEKKIYALDAASLKAISEESMQGEENLWSKVSEWTLPFYINFETKESGYVYPRVELNSAKAFGFNVVLALLAFLLFPLRSVRGQERVLKSIYVVLTGVAGLLALLMLPNFRK